MRRKVECVCIKKKIMILVPVFLLSLTSFFAPLSNLASDMTLREPDSVPQSSEPSDVSEWPMFRRSLNHTGYTPAAGPMTNNVIWNHTAGWETECSPAIVDGVVYFGYDNHETGFFALDAKNGSVLWSKGFGGSVRSSPAVADGVVYFGVNTVRKLFAYNATNGNQIWNYSFPSSLSEPDINSPAVADGIVYIGTWDGKLYAVNATDGSFLWSYTTSGQIWSSPAVVTGIVYFGSYDYNMYALNATDGTKIWNYQTGGWISSSPAVADGIVYFGSRDTKVYALNASAQSMTPAQRLIWDYTTGGQIRFSSPAVANDIVYIGSDDNKLYALNASDGSHIWNHSTGGDIHSSPAVANGAVYVGSDDGNVYCFYATNGTKIWDYSIGGVWWASPAISNGILYIGSRYGKRLYAIGLMETGGDWPMFHYGNRNRGYSSFETTVDGFLTGPQLLWSYDLPNTVYGSPVVADVDKDGKKEIFIDNGFIGEYVGEGGRLVCLNESGQLKWTFQIDPVYPWSYSTPAIGDIDRDGFDEILYLSGVPMSLRPDYHQALYALEPNGTLRWRSLIQGAGLASTAAADRSMPTIANITGGQKLEIVVQYAGREELYLFNYAGGRIWKYDYGWMDPDPYGGEIPSHVAPAVADFNNDNLGEIVVSTAWHTGGPYWLHGAVFMVDSAGNLLWSRQDIVPSSVYVEYIGSSPVIEDIEEDGTLEILVGSQNITKYGVWCLNQTGGTVWFYPMTVKPYGTVAVADIDNDGAKEVVFGAEDGYIYCLNNAGGLEWRYLTGDKVCSSAAIADIEKPPGGEPRQLEIVVGSLDGKLYCLNSTGGLLWTYNAGASIYSSPAIVDLQYSGEGNPEIIFAASNKLYALRIADVTINSHCYSEGVDVSVSITMDGSPTGYNTPHTFIGLTGTHTFTVPDIDPNGDPFFRWSTGEASTTITVNSGGIYTAYYGTRYNLTITRIGGGTTTPSLGTHTYWEGTIVTVTAIPSIVYVFDHWELDGSWYNDSNPTSVTMDSNHTLCAVFKSSPPPPPPGWPGGGGGPPALS